jgi:hypothetical protein
MRLVRIAAGVICAGAIAGIAINALVLQKSRHPAPLFNRHPQASVQASVDARTSALPVPNPTPKPVMPPSAATISPTVSSMQHIEDLLPPEKIPRTPTRGAQGKAGEAPEESPHDPIAQLLKTGSPTAMPIRSPHEPAVGEAKSKQPSKAVAAAQRALVKLGFVLKPDGMMGASTHQAIEQYERDHKLPPHGEVTPQLLNRLANETGVTAQ